MNEPHETKPRLSLFWPKIAACTLAVYATIYGVVVIVLGIANPSGEVLAMVAGLLCLAATPFLAFVHLTRASNDSGGPPARPRVMAFVMCAPAAFWFYVSWELFSPRGHYFLNDTLVQFGSYVVPALLSFGLAATFAWLGWRK